MTGGELAGLVMADATARLIPGVLATESLSMESHETPGVLEYPQYTRPESYPIGKKKSWDVPAVLLSGHHEKIKEWREEQQKKA